MKFKLVITKDIINESKECGLKPDKMQVYLNCALAEAYNELLPAHVCTDKVMFYTNKTFSTFIGQTPLTFEQQQFIRTFDKMTQYARYSLVGQEFDVEIPDTVIDQLYSSEVEVVQKLVNSKSLIPKTKNNDTIKKEVLA